MRTWRKQPRQIGRIDFTVYSFVLLILLIISTMEILTNPFSCDAGVGVRLPRTRTRAYQLFEPPIEQNAITIQIARNGNIYMRNDSIRSLGLTIKIQTDLNKGAIRRIYIFADAYAKYARVKTVIDAIRDARVEDVSFLVNQTNSSSLAVLTPSNR